MFAYGFEEAQIAGLQPSLFVNRLGLTPKTISLLCLKVRIRENGCWEWMGARQTGGYGASRVRSLSDKLLRTHRLFYETVHGPIDPPTLDLHHKTEDGCIGPSCVNPDHLMPVDRATHVRDLTPGSASYVNSRKESCPAGHPLQGDNMRVINGVRQCRACDRIRAQAKRDRLRTRPKFAKDPDKLKTKCFRDHDMTDESNIRWVNDSKGFKQRVCLACEQIRLAAYKVGKKADRLSTDHCKRGHAMVGDNVYAHPDGRRSCKTCRALHFKKRPEDLSDAEMFDVQDFSVDDGKWDW